MKTFILLSLAAVALANNSNLRDYEGATEEEQDI
jgi:hypothetical protein